MQFVLEHAMLPDATTDTGYFEKLSEVMNWVARAKELSNWLYCVGEKEFACDLDDAVLRAMSICPPNPEKRVPIESEAQFQHLCKVISMIRKADAMYHKSLVSPDPRYLPDQDTQEMDFPGDCTGYIVDID